MVVILTATALAVGLFGGRLWEQVISRQCPHCTISDERDRAIDELHDIEQQTIAQLTRAARAALQPDAAKHSAPRFYGEE